MSKYQKLEEPRERLYKRSRLYAGLILLNLDFLMWKFKILKI